MRWRDQFIGGAWIDQNLDNEDWTVGYTNTNWAADFVMPPDIMCDSIGDYCTN